MNVLGGVPQLIKRNETSVPHEQSAAGTLTMNIEDFDGNIRFGEAPYLFDTKWQPIGQRARIYNDPRGISGVAVVRDGKKWNALSREDLDALNYTSRTRELGPNEIAVYVNDAGYYLVMMVLGVDVIGVDHNFLRLVYYMLDPTGSPVLSANSPELAPDSAFLVTDDGAFLTDDEGKRLTVEAETFGGTGMSSTGAASTAGPGTGFGTGGFGTGPYGGQGQADAGDAAFELYPTYNELQRSALEARSLLGRLIVDENAGRERSKFAEHGEFGHNQPPPDIIVDAQAQAEALAALDAIAGTNPSTKAGQAAIKRAAETLYNAGHSLWVWLSPKLDKSVAIWMGEVAKLMASPSRLMIAWAMLSGQFMGLADAAMGFVQKLL